MDICLNNKVPKDIFFRNLDSLKLYMNFETLKNLKRVKKKCFKEQQI